MVNFYLIITLLAANALVANYICWLLTEWKRPLAQFKPLNCRPCLTFWLTNAIGALLVVCLTADTVLLILLGGIVVCSAFLNYIILTSKIQINE